MQFKRHVSRELVQALNHLHGSAVGAWWRGLLSDPEVFVAIRDEKLNAYYRGCSLAEIRLEGGQVRAATHYKYLLRPATASPYIDAVGGDYQLPEGWKHGLDSIFIRDLTELKDLKAAARPYTGEEKAFVGEVIRNHDSIFDVEIALIGEALDDTSEAETGRIDLAALHLEGDEVVLEMYEAKLFSNPELRAAGADVPVLEQVRRYERLLGEHAAAIRDSYIRAAENVTELVGMSPARRLWADRVLSAPQRFRLSLKPCLIISGFDADQKRGKAWGPHLNKLTGQLGKKRLIAAGNPRNVRLRQHG
jgi:hypothetical protein